MKKKIFAIAMITICIAIITSSTVAYFTAQGVAKNVITTGDVDITLEEWQEIDGKLVPYPKAETISVVPGEEISKIPTIKNNDQESYIRAQVLIIVKDSNGKVIKEVNSNEFADADINFNTTDWVKKDTNDNFWYYNKSVLKDESTEPLFSTVKFSADMSDEYKNTILEVKVKAEAVQTVNNGDNVLEASGWPTGN